MEDESYKSVVDFWIEHCKQLEEDRKSLRNKLATYEKLEKKLLSLYPDLAETPFITSWDSESYPPEYVHVCPAYGCSDLYVYKLELVIVQEGS